MHQVLLERVNWMEKMCPNAHSLQLLQPLGFALPCHDIHHIVLRSCGYAVHERLRHPQFKINVMVFHLKYMAQADYNRMPWRDIRKRSLRLELTFVCCQVENNVNLREVGMFGDEEISLRKALLFHIRYVTSAKETNYLSHKCFVQHAANEPTNVGKVYLALVKLTCSELEMGKQMHMENLRICFTFLKITPMNATFTSHFSEANGRVTDKLTSFCFSYRCKNWNVLCNNSKPKILSSNSLLPVIAAKTTFIS